MSERVIDREAEWVVVEHIKQLRKLLSLEAATAADIRQYAANVRFLLTDNGGALPRSAKLWGVKLLLTCPDTIPLVRDAENGYIEQFCASKIAIGSQTGCVVARIKPPSPYSKKYEFESKIQLEFQQFLRQKVLFGDGIFITRADVIRYVANKAGAIHWDRSPESEGRSLNDEKMRAIESIRTSVKFSTRDGVLKVAIPEVRDEARTEILYDPAYLDMVFIEFYGIAAVICDSPAVQELVSKIEEGLGKHRIHL